MLHCVYQLVVYFGCLLIGIGQEVYSGFNQGFLKNKKNTIELKGIAESAIRPIFAFVIISNLCRVTNLNLIRCSYADINC